MPDSSFFPSFAPFKPIRQNSASVERRQQEEYEEFGDWLTSDTYPFRYGVALDANGEITPRPKERFRSAEEMKWAETFDALGLAWEYEPLKFDMGPKHFSYTPDFRITDLSVSGSSRSLFVETKWFGEEMLLTKYVRFTEWYECDLLVLAYRKRKKTDPAVLAPHFLILRCPNCNTFEPFECEAFPDSDYIRAQNVESSLYITRQQVPYVLAQKFPFGYRQAEDGTFWLASEGPEPSFEFSATSPLSAQQQREYWPAHMSRWRQTLERLPCKEHAPKCRETPFERKVVSNCFVIQKGEIVGGPVLLARREDEINKKTSLSRARFFLQYAAVKPACGA